MAGFLLVSMTSPGLFPVKPTFVLSVTHSSREALTHTLCQEICGLTSHAHAGGYCRIRRWHDCPANTNTHTHALQNISTHHHTKTCVQINTFVGTQINTFRKFKVKDKTVGKGLKCLWWIETKHISRRTDRKRQDYYSLLCFAFEMVALWGIFRFRNAVLNGLGKSLNDLKSLYSSRQIFSVGHCCSSSRGDLIGQK